MPGVSTMFIKPTFKNSRKVKRIRNYADVSRTQKVCHVKAQPE